MRLHKYNGLAVSLLEGIAAVALCASPVIASAGPIVPHYGFQFRGGEWGNAQGNTDNNFGSGGNQGGQGDQGGQGGLGGPGDDGGNGNGNGDQGDGGNGNGSYNGGDGGGGGDGNAPPGDPPLPLGVPEPATWVLALAGVAGLWAARQRRLTAALRPARKIRS